MFIKIKYITYFVILQFLKWIEEFKNFMWNAFSFKNHWTKLGSLINNYLVRVSFVNGNSMKYLLRGSENDKYFFFFFKIHIYLSRRFLRKFFIVKHLHNYKKIDGDIPFFYFKWRHYYNATENGPSFLNIINAIFSSKFSILIRKKYIVNLCYFFFFWARMIMLK